MITFKCKMCGGDLHPEENVTTCECEYCGSVQTIPTADNEKKMNLFGRAQRLLRACEFDKAAGVYESIVAEFPDEAEAYWGLVLCKYGIEYVDDPGTGKKVPTCHRSSFDSVMDDINFDQACENADPVARRVYRDEAKTIEELRKGIIEVSGKEDPYDIFICYKETDENGERTLDSVIAQDIYNALTEKGYRVFFSRISLEDKLGKEYEPYIFAALNSAKVMLAVGTDYEYYNAIWVKNEWSRFLKLIASGEKKTLIPCFKNLDAYDMPKEFARLQAQDLGKVGAMQDLLRGIEKILPRDKTEQAVPIQAFHESTQTSGPTANSLSERGYLSLEDGQWEKAKQLFDEVLNIDPKCAEAYIGLILSERKINTKDEFARLYIDGKIKAEKNMSRASQFAQGETAEWLMDIENKAQNREMELRERLGEKRKRFIQKRKLIHASDNVTWGIRENGTVIFAGYPRGNINSKIRGWTDIVTIHAGFDYIIGLKSNGHVVSAGVKRQTQRAIDEWTDIVDLCASDNCVLGLKLNGSVVAAGEYIRGVDQWKNIVELSMNTSGRHVVALNKEGTVVAFGDNQAGQCDVFSWTRVAGISAGNAHTVGLLIDGSVNAVGANDQGQCNVGNWNDIVGICTGGKHTIGLKENGTVVATGDNSFGQCDVDHWKDIVAVCADRTHTVGLKYDGTVLAVGTNSLGECNVAEWKLFDAGLTIESKQQTTKEQQLQRRTILLDAESRLRAELKTLRGFFSGIRRKEIEEELDQIHKELNEIDSIVK